MRDNQGRCFTKNEELEKICLNFFLNYQHKEVSGYALREVLGDLPITFIASMNEALSWKITEKELSSAILSMAKGKASRHDKILIEFFQKNWPTIGLNFHQMVCKGMENGAFHKGVT